MKRAHARRSTIEPEPNIMSKALHAATLAGCVVHPAHPVYYRGPVAVY
ncbi:hypothetical protein [Caballeronia fortuita]|nr:hypothetical protein [Caballeronia fortuita]